MVIYSNQYQSCFASIRKPSSLWRRMFKHYKKYPEYVVATDDPDEVQKRINIFKRELKKSKLFNKVEKEYLHANMIERVLDWFAKRLK